MQTKYIISCFVVRRRADSFEFLQLFRSPGKYLGETWQLVNGKIEGEEKAWQAALREISEETSLVPREFYQLDVVNTFFAATIDAIVHAAMFCAIVDENDEVILNAEHTQFRWVAEDQIASLLMWPGERIVLQEVRTEILRDGSSKPFLRIALP